jgi:anti-anti-sigma factor
VRIWFSDTRRVCVLTLEGEYDLVGKNDLREALLSACEAERLVLVDFGDVTFIDSSAVGIIVGAHKRCTSAGKQLLLVNVRGAPLRVLRMLGLQHLFSAPMDPRDAPSERMLKRV